MINYQIPIVDYLTELGKGEHYVTVEDNNMSRVNLANKFWVDPHKTMHIVVRDMPIVEMNDDDQWIQFICKESAQIGPSMKGSLENSTRCEKCEQIAFTEFIEGRRKALPRWWKEAEQFTLGDLIDSLKQCKSDAMVFFDFGELVPYAFNSYRGYYEDLALDFKEYGYEGGNPTAEEFLKLCEEQVGSIHTGWKGGEYTMDRDTSIWVAHTGDSTHTMLSGVMNDDYRVYLITKLNLGDSFCSDDYSEHTVNKTLSGTVASGGEV